MKETGDLQGCGITMNDDPVDDHIGDTPTDLDQF